MELPKEVWDKMSGVEQEEYLILLSNGSKKMIDEFEKKIWSNHFDKTLKDIEKHRPHPDIK